MRQQHEGCRLEREPFDRANPNHSDEGRTLEMLFLESFYSGQITL